MIQDIAWNMGLIYMSQQIGTQSLITILDTSPHFLVRCDCLYLLSFNSRWWTHVRFEIVLCWTQDVHYFVYVDVDECTAFPNICGANADCHNTDGSYICNCKAGYSGDGKTCSRAGKCINWLKSNKFERFIRRFSGSNQWNGLPCDWPLILPS